MKKVILATILLLSAIAVIVVFVFPSFNKFMAARATLDQKRQEIKELTDYISQIQKISDQLREAGPQLAKIDQALLQPYYLPSVFQFVQMMSSSAGVRMEAITLGDENPLKENKSISIQEVKVKISGSYIGLKNFLEALENSSRLISIASISFTGETNLQDSNKKTSPVMELYFNVFSYAK